ncbi:MAG: MoaD/ThiS family protein [Pseudomonadota bacterium]
MKSVQVQYFALFRERAGMSHERVETDATTLLELFNQLQHRHGTADPHGHCKVALNDVMAEWQQPFADGDTVLFFPPVAGG